jgi:hypothetical protein
VVDVDISKPKMGPGEALALGIDFQTYSRDFDRAVSAAYIAREHEKQERERATREALLQVHGKKLEDENRAWGKIQHGLTVACTACGAPVQVLLGSYRAGDWEENPAEAHCFRTSYENHVILTTPPCGACQKHTLIDLGTLSSMGPRNFSSLPTMEKTFGVASDIPVSVKRDSRPSLRERLGLLGAGH